MLGWRLGVACRQRAAARLRRRIRAREAGRAPDCAAAGFAADFGLSLCFLLFRSPNKPLSSALLLVEWLEAVTLAGGAACLSFGPALLIAAFVVGSELSDAEAAWTIRFPGAAAVELLATTVEWPPPCPAGWLGGGTLPAAPRITGAGRLGITVGAKASGASGAEAIAGVK